jgi:hypothetical protein
MKKRKAERQASELTLPMDLLIAATILNGMISSNPIVDRTKVDKALWARLAVEWADALIAAAKAKR